jgi:hypothetical protein
MKVYEFLGAGENTSLQMQGNKELSFHSKALYFGSSEL